MASLAHPLVWVRVAEHDYIQMVLTEREREDIFRFKHLKQALH